MDKKTRMIGVRVTEEEYKKLKDSDTNISTILRNAIEEKLMSHVNSNIMIITFKNDKGEESTKKTELISSPQEMLKKVELATSIAKSLGLSVTIDLFPSFEVSWPSSQKAS